MAGHAVGASRKHQRSVRDGKCKSLRADAVDGEQRGVRRRIDQGQGKRAVYMLQRVDPVALPQFKHLLSWAGQRVGLRDLRPSAYRHHQRAGLRDTAVCVRGH